MSPKTIVSLIVCIYISFFSFSQSEQDEKYLGKIYSQINNLDSIYFYADKLEKSKDSCFIYEGKIHKSRFYYKNDEIESSEKLAKTILKELKNNNGFCFVKIKIEALNRLFWIHKNKKLYNEAYNYILLSENEIAKISKDNDYYNVLYSTIQFNNAHIKSVLGYHKESIEILKNIFAIYSSGNIPENHQKYTSILNQAICNNLIGEAYLNSAENSDDKDLDYASDYFQKAYEIAKTFDPPHQNSETLYQLREAEVLVAKKQFKNSLDLINKYSKNSKEFNTYQKINALKAICFYNLNIKDSTLFYCRKFLNNYNKERHNKEKLIAIYDILSKQYYQIKKIDSAFKYSELTIAELNLFNENKSLVNKAHYLHNYNDINTLNKNIINKERKKRFWFGIIAVLTMLVLIWIIYFYKSNKSRVEKELETLKEKNINSEKTDYNIDKKTEENILEGITQFEKSKGFLDKRFTINRLAKKLDTNTSYLSFVFNKKYDQSFKQYITQLRIEYIITELRENTTLRNYTIKALAEEIGYTNASAFTRAFKKHTGITPSEYIRSLS